MKSSGENSSAESCAFPSLSALERLDDERVIQFVARDCSDALAVLFARHHRLVMSIILKMLRDPAEAEDVMQEVFISVYRQAGNFRPELGSGKTWILQFVYQRTVDRLRYLNSRMFYELQQLLDSDKAGQEESAWTGLSRQECSHLVHEALESLGEKQRQTIELAHFRGLLLREISNHLGESLPNVRHRYYRGLRKLRQFISRERSDQASLDMPAPENSHAKR